jgi:hypothetical protein
MTVLALPTHGRWAWDARGERRALRVSTHAEAGVVNLSIWRDDICVGTVRLLPADVATLMAGLGEGMAELASSAGNEDRRGSDGDRLRALEERLAQLERRPPTPAWRALGTALLDRARQAVRPPRGS